MKLTPLDIQQQRFPRGLSGYDKKEVHSFLEFVSREVESLLTEVGHLRERIGKQDDELFRYREREETLKEALVTAQKMAEDMRTQAKKESDLIIAEAEMKAERIIHSAHGRLLQILEEISDLKRQRVQLVASIRQVVETHSKLLDSEPQEKAQEEESVTYLRTKSPLPPPVPAAPLPEMAKARDK
jgi:cell division initiation protein